MFTEVIANLKSHPKAKIVFTEGTDPRILTAASRLAAEEILIPIVLGNEDEIKAVADKERVSLDGITLINPFYYPRKEEMIQLMFELRKGKMTEMQCRQNCSLGNYFGTMLVKMGEADGLLGGATYTTADTVRPALQLIKTKPDCKLVSSSFILYRNTDNGPEKYVMGDCAINTYPNAEELADIADETAKTARLFGFSPKVAFLSYGTLGSAKGESVDIVREAVENLRAMNVDYPVDGELQFDAAFSPVVAKLKAPHSEVAGQANVFIFPNIDAGNIGYKMAQRLGGFEAIGPILQGLNAPINDLSRGCNAEEVYQLALITAMQTHM